MAKKDKDSNPQDNLNISKEEYKFAQERVNALKEELGLKSKINEEGKTQLDLTRKVASQALDFLSKQQQGLASTKSLQNDYNKAKQLQNKLDISIEKTGGKTSKIVKDSKNIQDEIVKSKFKELELAEKIDNSLGLAGKSVSVMNKLLGGTLGDTSSILDNARDQLASQTGSINKMKGFGLVVKGVGKSIMGNLNDPLTYLMAMLENSTAITKFQNDLGIGYSSAVGIREEMTDIANSSGDVFITSKKIGEAFSTMNQELGFIVDNSGQTLETMVNLEKRLGLAAGEAAKLTMLFKLQGDNTEEQAANLADSLTTQIKSGNVALSAKQIFNEIAKTTAIIQVSLGGTAEEIGSAIISAKQLGAELSDIDGIAGSILNFESSISSELNAELLTGKQLNLERARLLALNNDLAGVADEVAAQGIDYNFMTTANRLEQEAIAEALGLSRDRLASIVQQQEFQGKSSKEIRDTMGESAYENFKALGAQEKFTASVEKLKGLFSDIMVVVTPFIDGLAFAADIVGGLLGMFGRLTPIVAGIAAYSIFGSFAAIPMGLGIPLAIGAVGAMKNLITSTMNDGVIGSDGGMVVSGPKGSIQLNKDDSIIAGTNLGGGSGGGEKFDYNKMASAMSQVQINTSVRHDSFSSKNQSANHGSYQSDARHQTRFA